MPKCGTRNAWFGYFWAGTWKQYCHIWNQHPWICLIAKFRGKTKMPKFRTKNDLFGYFWPKMPYLGIFGVEFQKWYCHIWNQHLQICVVARFFEKTKIPKFGTKNALFGYLWARILKNYYHIWNELLRICLNAKFCKETKMPKFGTKSAIFGCFWLKMLYLSIFGQEF